MIKVLLVDDHELVRIGIESLLNAAEDITVVGVADSGEQALLLTTQYQPDVILMDLKMPGMGGVEACTQILLAHPQVKIIGLSAYSDGLLPQQLLKLGAAGFLSKNSPLNEMVSAIKNVMAGKTYVCAEVAAHYETQPNGKHKTNPFQHLSKREIEVTHLILQGHSIQEMAELLKLSDKTVNTYRYRLYEKLQVKNDVELTHLATKWDYAYQN